MTVHRRVVVLLLAAVAASMLLALSPTARALVGRADQRWHAAVVAAQHPVVLAISHGLALAGAAVVTIPLRVAVSLWLAVRRSWWLLGAWVVSIALSEAAVTLMKAGYDRARPSLALEVTRSAAYPSGHTAAAAAIATALVLLLVPAGRPRGTWGAVASVVVLLMALSRTYLRVHWLSDVVAGAAVGAAASVTAVAVVALLERRHLRRAAPPPGAPASQAS